MSRIKHAVRCYIERISQRKKGTHISKKVKISGKTFFEGFNYVGEESELVDCSLGKLTYIAHNCKFNKTIIGRFTSIGPNCKVIYGDHPTKTFVSTHPAFYTSHRPAGKCYVNQEKFEEIKYLDKDKEHMLCIGNDVWIASDVKLLSGIKIGDGAIICSGAIVTKDAPPYSIVGGIPGKVIRFRFSEDEIEWLLELKWWDKDEKWIQKYADDFEDLDKFKTAVTACEK